MWITCALISSLIIEDVLLLINDNNSFSVSFQNEEIVYSVKDMTFENLSVSGKGLTIALTNDPQIYLNDANKYVDSIQIFTKELSSATEILQVYYTNNGEYTEDNCIRSLVQSNEKCHLTHINSTVSSLRIDIGSSVRDSYTLEKIVVNPSVYSVLNGAFKNTNWTRVICYFFAIMICLSAMQNIALFKECVYKYRWLMGVEVIVLGTALKINGSSIGGLAEGLERVDISR